MLYDPETRELFTDDGQFLKVLGCAEKVNWNEMPPEGSQARRCQLCSRLVHDTATMSDTDVEALLQREPGACLTVSFSQRNVKLRLSPLKPFRAAE